MNIFTPIKHKTIQSIVASFLILSVLAGMLSACNMNVVIPTPIGETGVELPPSQTSLVTQEMPLSSPTMASIETATNNLIKIDPDNIIYPPMGDVEENFEKGEYDASVETIKQWVNTWEKMGVFGGIGDIYDTGLVLVPLVGKEKVSCVALKSDKYAKTLFCPPFDNTNGGLRIISDSGQGQETDKPIIVNLRGTEGLTIKGRGNDLTYQIADKYSNNGIRYYDINTKGFVEGSYIAPLEVKENEPIEGSVVCVADEFCMGGQMTVDQEIGGVFYKKYIEALMINRANRDYFTQILGNESTYEKLQEYLDKNDGYVPAGLKLLGSVKGSSLVQMIATKEPINLRYLRTIVIGPKQWHDNVGGIKDYLDRFDKSSVVNPYAEDGFGKIAYFGWYLDENKSLVLVNGALDYASAEGGLLLGGTNGEYIEDRDNLIASGHAISFIVYTDHTKYYTKDFNYKGRIVPFFGSPFDTSPQVHDVKNILGGNLFKKH